MKRNDLNAIITGIVHRYIEDGWVLEMDNSIYSNVDGVHFLSRGRECVAVGIRRPERGELDGRLSDLRGLDPRILFECRAPKRAFDWLVSENAISERVLFKVAEDWYVEDSHEAGMAMGKRRERWMTRDCDRAYSLLSFHPTEAFLDKYIRQRRGWKTVKPADIIIEKRDGAYWIRKDFGNRDFFAVSFLPER